MKVKSLIVIMMVTAMVIGDNDGSDYHDSPSLPHELPPYSCKPDLSFHSDGCKSTSGNTS